MCNYFDRVIESRSNAKNRNSHLISWVFQLRYFHANFFRLFHPCQTRISIEKGCIRICLDRSAEMLSVNIYYVNFCADRLRWIESCTDRVQWMEIRFILCAKRDELISFLAQCIFDSTHLKWVQFNGFLFAYIFILPFDSMQLQMIFRVDFFHEIALFACINQIVAYSARFGSGKCN